MNGTSLAASPTLSDQNIRFRECMMSRLNKALLQVSPSYPILEHLPLKSDHSSCDKRVSQMERDNAASNIRLLNIFYGYTSSTFALALHILDRLLATMQDIESRHLSALATTCFYMAAKVTEEEHAVPNLSHLIRISQCSATPNDILAMERNIVLRLRGPFFVAPTPYLFLFYFNEILVSSTNVHLLPEDLYPCLCAKVEVLMCNAKFNSFHPYRVALTLLEIELRERDLLLLFDGIITDLYQFFQTDAESLEQCKSAAKQVLENYKTSRIKRPKNNLNWAVSKRTLSKLRPSARLMHDLETIAEDDSIPQDVMFRTPLNSEGESEPRTPEPEHD